MQERVLLYAEDEDAAVFLLDLALREAKIAVNVHRVADGEEALQFLNRQGIHSSAPRPDMVLLDLNLPRKSGHEVLTEMSENSELRTLPVVVFTSSSATADRRRSMALGARMHITKPPSFDAFVDAIRQACASAGIRPGENGHV